MSFVCFSFCYFVLFHLATAAVLCDCTTRSCTLNSVFHNLVEEKDKSLFAKIVNDPNHVYIVCFQKGDPGF